MTPQQAYEKRYGNPWSDAAPGVQDLWLSAWTIAWAMAEQAEREECARAADKWASNCVMEARTVARAIAHDIRTGKDTQ